MDLVERLKESATDTLSEARSASTDVAGSAGCAADYIRSRDFRKIGRDLSKYVSSNPVQAMVAMTAFGFLTGLLLRRR